HRASSLLFSGPLPRACYASRLLSTATPDPSAGLRFVVDARRIALLVGQLQLAVLVHPELRLADCLVVIGRELDRRRRESLCVDVQVVQRSVEAVARAAGCAAL